MATTHPQPAQLSDLARAALGLAQAAGYSVYVEAAGQKVRLGPAGVPGRNLVIALGEQAAEPPTHPSIPPAPAGAQ